MIFNQSYYNAMDRGYYLPAPSEDAEASVASGAPTVSPEIGLEIENIGISTPPMKDQLETLKSRIFQGAKKVELGFTGRGKGSMGSSNTTPEMYGKDERMDIRELAKLNKVQLTTHATTEAGSLSGWGQQKFDENNRENTLHEIERAIDFAADTTNGGAVVVHGIEHPRPILDRKYFNEDGFEFQGPPAETEENKVVTHLVDKRSGAITPVDRSTPLSEPVYEIAEGYDKNDDTAPWASRYGGTISRYEDKTEELAKRIPVWDGEKFKTTERSWGYIKDLSDRWEKATGQKMSPEQHWFRIHLENNILRTRGNAKYMINQWGYEDQRAAFDAANDLLGHLNGTKSLSDSDMPKIQEGLSRSRLVSEQQADVVVNTLRQPNLSPEEDASIRRLAENVEDNSRKTLEFIEESASSSYADIKRTEETLNNAQPIEQYSAQKAADTVSRAAIYAMDREKRPSKEGVWGWDVRHGEEFEKPLFIAIENFFPDMNGGHPEEVRRMVTEARGDMEKKLKERGMSEAEAKKTAVDRIKATWDTSHANMWRKYFKANKNESIEQTDARFKEWYLKQARKWVDEDIIGHVHVSDNFGWEDEHVVPGQGNAPIKEFVQEIKQKAEKGEIDVIVEPSHNDYRAMLGGWKIFGSSIYGAQAGARDGWTEVERGYFGRNAPPYFLYGESAPDPESWMLWSGTRME